MAEFWKPGDQILTRSVWGQRILAAWPVTVVTDTPELLALYLAAGSPYKRAQYDPDGPRLPIGELPLVDDVWKGDLIRLNRPAEAYGLLGFYEGPQGEFSRWYVNLESPYQRTSQGIDFEDHMLDIIISPDLSNWTWKDEDEIKAAVNLRLITEGKAERIRAEGERVIERLESRSSPFNDGWEKWRPDPAWPVPELPVGWDTFK